MKKITSLVLAIFVAAIFSTLVSAAMQDTYEFKGGAMGKITFPHKMHQEKLGDCKICHHKNEAGKEQSCFECHSKDSKVKAKDAFHNRCKKCHTEQGKGPKSCKECHKK